MKPFLYNILIQWKLDLRNKNILLTYYVIPLVFYGFMGAIFTNINPASKETLIQSMIVFNVSMGAFLGMPAQLVDLYSSDIKKAYRVGGIPIWSNAVITFISAMIHLLITSLIIYSTSHILFDSTIPVNTFIFFIALMLFIATSLGVGTILGLFAKDPSKIAVFSQIIFLPSIMLSGIMFPASLLPNAFEKIGYIYPATWGFKNMVSSEFLLGWISPLIVVFSITILVNTLRLIKLKNID
ncbi:ABC transporter permease [Mycoplasmatota bacterium]|nr:ABC transporter permease [Mycoplasmatota bacterium]